MSSHTSQKSSDGISLRKNMLWNTVGSVFYQGCLWLMTVLVVRLSPDYQNSGALAFAMSIGNIYTALGTYTMRTYQVSDVTGRYSASNYVALRLVTVLGGLTLCLIYALAISPSISTLLVIGGFLLFKADEAFANVLYGCDQIAMRLDYVGRSQIVRGTLVVGIFCVAMVFTQNLALTLVLVFLSCLAVTFLYDIPRSRTLVDSLVPAISRHDCLALLKECLPSVLGNVVGGLIVSSARQYFGIAYGEAALGIYASVATPCVIIQVLAQNLYTPLLGPIAEKYRGGRSKETREASLKLMGLVLGVALGLSVLLSLASHPLLTTIYGQSIEPYVNVLPLALVVMTGVAMDSVICDLLIVFGRLKRTLAVNAVAFAVNALLIVPFTAAWYMNGINLSLMGGYAIALALGVVWVMREASTPWKNDGDNAA